MIEYVRLAVLRSRSYAAGPSGRRWLLACGIVGVLLYPLSDIVAAMRYPGFSYRDQAVSELFAIGAPTSGLVVPEYDRRAQEMEKIASAMVKTIVAIVYYLTAVIANEPTPWMGTTERASQYATRLWYAVLAIMLLRSPLAPSRSWRSDLDGARRND